LNNDDTKPSVSPILLEPSIDNHPKPYTVNASDDALDDVSDATTFDIWSNLSNILNENNNPEQFCLKPVSDFNFIRETPSFIKITEQNKQFMEFMFENKICMCYELCNDLRCKSITFDRMLNI
jgi:hypothetical protein